MNTSKKQIYLDYAATTPVDKAVAEEMSKYMTVDGVFANPSSNHCFGFDADDAVEQARTIISNFLDCHTKDIIFTSGATESNNLVIKGFARANKEKGNHIITVATEHKAVLDACRALEDEGFNITYLKPDENGKITADNLKHAITTKTILVSIMHVNNETGLIQDIASLGNILKEQKIFFHVDAVQSLGKLAIDLSSLPIDSASFSSHKIYGPKGIGALFIRNRAKTKLDPLVTGGGQEFGIRPGTLPTHQIVGFGKAIKIAENNIDEDYMHIAKLNKTIVEQLSKIKDSVINTDLEHSLPNIINISFMGVDSVSLITALQNDIAISSGSACTSGAIEPSHVITGMGLSDDRVNSAVRISVGRYTSQGELNTALEKITHEVERIREC